MSDYRTVINGRVGIDGVVYSHPDLKRFEGQELKVAYGLTTNVDGLSVRAVLAWIPVGQIKAVCVLEAV